MVRAAGAPVEAVTPRGCRRLQTKSTTSGRPSFSVHAEVGPPSATVAEVSPPRSPSIGRRSLSAVLRAGLRVGLSAGVLAGAVSGCAGTELERDPTFDGTWSVARLEVDGTGIDVDGSGLVIEIDTAAAAVQGRTGCGRLFGSYTLTHDPESVDEAGDEGPASFTIPSPAPDESCPPADRDRHESLVAALETVSRWQREGPLLLLVDDPTTTVELRPVG